MGKATCSEGTDCGPVVARGLCDMHYRRAKRSDYPLPSRIGSEDRFWAKVDKTGECWLWIGSCNHKGYGVFRVAGRLVKAHRFAYELLVGPIPDGLTLDHLCRVRRCVNPAHLESVTNYENILRGDSFSARNAVKTHCPHGHPYDDANTYVSPSGRRSCRECSRGKDRRQQASLL